MYKGRITSLQSLRGLLFLLIFLYHAGISNAGMWAVSAFFLLSGFVLMYSYFDIDIKDSYKDCFNFSKRKIKKLFFLNILVNMVAFVYSYISHDIYKIQEAFCVLPLKILLLDAWIPNENVYWALNGVSWYFSASFFLYIIFPKIRKSIKKLNITNSIKLLIICYSMQILVGIIIILISSKTCFDIGFYRWFTYISPLYRVLDFVIGACFALLYIKLQHNKNHLFYTLVEIALIVLVFLCIKVFDGSIKIQLDRNFYYSIIFTPTAALVIYFTAIRKGKISNFLTNEPLIKLGNISGYAFLLSEIPGKFLTVFLDLTFHKSIYNKYLYAIITFVLILIAAKLYIIIEGKIRSKLEKGDSKHD